MLRKRLLQVSGLGAVLLVLGATGGQAADSFRPNTVSLTLAPGASWKTAQTLHLDALPPKADVVLAVDTTGSMGAAIVDARADAISIVNRVKSSITGARFAVVDFKDYPFAPFGSAGDYPYELVSGLTSDATAVEAAMNTMSAGGGNDLPESFNRVFFEAYSDTTPHDDEVTPYLAYDANAPRFLIVLADDIPHDTAQNATFSACQNTSLTDPGRDATVDTSDDLATEQTLDGLKANNTNVSFVTYNPGGGSPGTPECHAQMAAYTGGLQVTHGATDSLADEIVSLVKQAAAKIDAVDLEIEPNEGTPASVASWVTFSPPGPYGPFTAPRDIPYEMKITVPAGTSAGTYEFMVRAVADGSPRAEQLVRIEVRTQAASGLNLTVDERSIGAGVSSLPLASFPASRVPFLGGTTSALPAGSIPAGSIPAGSIPAGSIPAGSIPAGSIPAGSIPAGSIPYGSIPAGSIPYGSIGLGDTPAGSIPAGSIPAALTYLQHVLLSQIPLRNTTWDAILAPPSALNACPTTGPAAGAGACRPLTAITLADVANDSVALARLNALPISDVPLFSTLWRDAPFAALLLGNAKLSQLPQPPGYASWNDALESNGGSSSNVDPATDTVFGVYVAGQLGSTPAGSIPAGSIPYGSIPAGSIPAGSIKVGEIVLGMTRLGAVLISELPAGFVNCSGGFSCTDKTLGQADDAGAVNPNLTLAQLFAALPSGHPGLETTLDQLIAAMLPLSNYPWEEISLSGLQDVAGSPPLHYHLDFDLNCAIPTSFELTVNLPDGFMPVLGSTKFSYAGGLEVAGRNPTANDTGDFVFTPQGTSPCGASNALRHVRMNFNAYAGLTLGDHTSDATVRTETATEIVNVQTVNDQAPVLVVQNHEPNDDPLTSPVIAENTLIAGHVADGADKEYFRFPFGTLPRHSKLVAYLNVPEGADLDLVVHKQFSPALQSSPAGSIPAGSIPVEDLGASVDNANRTLPPETLADVPAGSIPAGSVPAGSIPAGSISANRGSASEAAQIVKRDEQGDAIVSISGFNGSHSNRNYTLRLQVIDPPALPPCPGVMGLGSATPGTLPAPSSLPAATKTLFLVNRQRLAGLYPGAVDGLLAAGSPLRTVAARSEVAGAVIPVDGDANVRAAYTAWDQNPCSVDAANGVVRRINTLLATYRTALPQLRYVVVLGTDQVIPMYRQDDLTSLSPELDEASDLAFTTNNLATGNALYASAAQNTVLTDGAYGALTQLTWLGHDLPLAQTPVSRLLETPADMNGQFDQYLSSDGRLDPKSELTTGYDFLSDGADDIHSGLTGQFASTPSFALDTLISLTGDASQWTRDDFLAKYFNKTVGGNPAVPDVVSPNAHYSHWLAQPAGPITSLADMVTSADVPGADKINGRIVFTMGCHGGLNVPDNLSTDVARRDDWAQRYLGSKTAVYIANTGFGYGDTVSVALSERLLGLFAKKINSPANTSIGEQWIDALTTYYLTAGDYDVFDEKAMIEATFYGLPFYHFPTQTTPPAPPPPVPTADGTVEKLSLAPIAPNPVLQPLTEGRKWWAIDGLTLNVPYRPVQPLYPKDVTVPGKSARGVFITSLATHDVLNVKPLIAYPRVDSQLREPDPDFRGTFWPANVVSLLRTKSLGQEKASVVVKAGQFRPNTVGNPALGTERLVDSIGLDVAYSSSTDTTAPNVRQVGGVIHDELTTFFVRTADTAGIKKVAVLYNDGTQANWTLLPLTHVSGDLYTADVSGLTTPTHVIGEAMDLNGNTGYGANKGENHTSFTDPPDGSGLPDIRIDVPRPTAIFTLNQPVTADFACTDEGGIRTCTGATLVAGNVDTSTPGPHSFTVTATDLAGNTVSKSVSYVVRYGFQGFKPPVDNPPTINVAKLGSTIPIKWSLVDAAGRYVSDLNAITSISWETMRCPSATTDVIEETTSPPLVALKYDTAGNQFIFHWKTEKSWGTGCRRVWIAFADGPARIYADFQLK